MCTFCFIMRVVVQEVRNQRGPEIILNVHGNKSLAKLAELKFTWPFL